MRLKLKCKTFLSFMIIAFVCIPAIPSSADTVNYIYDDLSRLTRVEYSDGYVIMYEYDEVGNRQQKKIYYKPHTLTVQKTGTGSGAVTSSPAGINCGSDCQEVYSEGTSIALSVVADNCMTFNGWSGGCSGQGSCAVNLNADAVVNAEFILAPADFLASPLTGYAPLSVAFQDMTPCATSWSWNFGDSDPNNTNTSTEQNPAHTYRKPGTYTVTLSATNPNGSSTVTKTNLITGGTCANQPVRIGSTYFASVTDAVNAAASGNTIEIQAVDFTESLSINKNLTLNGGFDCSYSSRPSSTAVQGNVAIETGIFTVNMDSILVN